MPRQQVRVQQRKVKPKAMELAAPPKARQRRLQPRLLEGRSAQTVIRLSLYLAAYQLALAIAGIGLGFLFSDWPLKILDAPIFLLGIVAPGTLVCPALVLALRDRNATPEPVQRQLAGASPVSPTCRLWPRLLNTRH